MGPNFQRVATPQATPAQIVPQYQISPQFGTVTTRTPMPSLTCDQFLALSPADARARTGASFYDVIAKCLQVTAPRNKFADLAVSAPNITSDGYRRQRYGIDWLYAYVAYKLLTSSNGCSTWNYLTRTNTQAPAVQQYCVQFGLGSLSAAEIANVIRIANYICGRLGPAGMATRPAGQASDGGLNIVPILVIAGFVGFLGLFAYVNEEERKKNREKYMRGSQWT